MALCQTPHGGWTLRTSVVSKEDWTSILYLHFVCNMRQYIDTLGIFYVNQTSVCLDPHQKWGWGWYIQTCLSPPVNILLTVPERFFFCESSLGFFALCWYVTLSCVFLATFSSPAAKRLASWFSFIGWFLVRVCVFFKFSMWCPRSGVVFNCINSWPLPFSLLFSVIIFYGRRWIDPIPPSCMVVYLVAL